MSIRRALAVVVAAIIATALPLAGPATAADGDVVPGTPTITGTAQLGRTLAAVAGTWQPTDVALSYQWLRDGTPVGTDSPDNRTRTLSSTDDVGAVYTVRVTGTKDGRSAQAVSAPTRPVAKAVVTNTERPTISGSSKYLGTLTASGGRWSRGGLTRHYRWLRDDRPIAGATHRTYTVAPADVGRKIRVRVSVTRPGFVSASARSKARTGQHLRPVRRTVTYQVSTRGSVSASVSTFKRLAQETYDDPRGWRSVGIRFKRVSKGGDFTLVLSQASKVPSFSSACSATWSCRVGRYVVINQTRWQKASPAWKANGGSLRSYRHLVVNHETGHWLGKGHASCGGTGRLAPVMQQQSKSLGGCRINPWPTPGERHAPRFGY